MLCHRKLRVSGSFGISFAFFNSFSIFFEAMNSAIYSMFWRLFARGRSVLLVPSPSVYQSSRAPQEIHLTFLFPLQMPQKKPRQHPLADSQSLHILQRLLPCPPLLVKKPLRASPKTHQLITPRTGRQSSSNQHILAPLFADPSLHTKLHLQPSTASPSSPSSIPHRTLQLLKTE